ncbi:hypothetical protein [Chitinophaga defluvii]|uniref:Uncharacterized protein n=1 Tax=Chitinophaga defluvii TaxID=3163343 RepID=A0ABV2TB05_9BACT
MNWMNDLYHVYQKLDIAGYQQVKQDILTAQITGCNSGEIYYLILQQLVLIKKEQPAVYELIKNEAESIIRSGGLGYAA